ncbi:helix-turn-helix transcriptional regulator [Staphylococcus hominis]|uniref:helix-turn-helix transcriptional regulator n=1 Tax=Staphylococcus hominis TaxID=1290 RepID=UPI001304ED06|nr:helix-turn-helix transcriptional regulator [Staphylococcus hominis]
MTKRLNKLENARKDSKLTQEELAAIIHISKSSYSDKVVGRQQFRMDEMIRICNYFNKTLNDLFWEDEKVDKNIYI